MAVSPMNGPNRWFFDLWSRFYDVPLVQQAAYEPVHRVVLEQLRRPRPRSILDVGCGTGMLASRLAEALPRTRVVGCDFSRGMLRQALARSSTVRWVRGDAGQLPFADASFDVVVSTEAFHWFPDQVTALAELHRVLVPGGRLLLELIHPPWSVVSEAMLRLSTLAGEPFYWPPAPLMRQRVVAAGFRVVEQRPIWRWLGGPLFPAVLTIARRTPHRVAKPVAAE